MKNLTSIQRDILTQRYVQLCIDSMDYESMEQFVYKTLLEDYNCLSDSEIKDEIKYTFDEETLDELIDNLDNELVEVN